MELDSKSSFEISKFASCTKLLGNFESFPAEAFELTGISLGALLGAFTKAFSAEAFNKFKQASDRRGKLQIDIFIFNTIFICHHFDNKIIKIYDRGGAAYTLWFFKCNMSDV